MGFQCGNMISRLIMVVALVGSLVCGINGEGTYSRKLYGGGQIIISHEGGINPALSGDYPLPLGMNDFRGENFHPGSRQPSGPFGGVNDLPDQSNSPFDYRPVG
ncbi:PREDICTED: uncharacterized protein LOC109237120 [Nicotiana attenuata]|uniref:Cell wall protein n=1 Tax=Nicotiana attenuata TaxID=49451 RepID=A0A314LEV5_NICAT|nr:PREDICTED: uncharacterized protein LOC109237120 [Nicotiana attenuata]OIT40188.1 hypothetical protein A4A49_00083 [Nicotiana attenuata]